MKIVSTSSFRVSFALLTKRQESGYSSCAHDVCDELSGQSFDDIYNRHFLVKQMGDLRVIKLRIQNSIQNLSSAAGYRLIIVCNKTQGHVALLKIYPKRGKHSKSDLTKDEYRELLNEYGKELKGGILKSHDIKQMLKII